MNDSAFLLARLQELKAWQAEQEERLMREQQEQMDQLYNVTAGGGGNAVAGILPPPNPDVPDDECCYEDDDDRASTIDQDISSLASYVETAAASSSFPEVPESAAIATVAPPPAWAAVAPAVAPAVASPLVGSAASLDEEEEKLDDEATPTPPARYDDTPIAVKKPKSFEELLQEQLQLNQDAIAVVHEDNEAAAADLNAQSTPAVPTAEPAPSNLTPERQTSSAKPFLRRGSGLARYGGISGSPKGVVRRIHSSGKIHTRNFSKSSTSLNKIANNSPSANSGGGSGGGGAGIKSSVSCSRINSLGTAAAGVGGRVSTAPAAPAAKSPPRSAPPKSAASRSALSKSASNSASKLQAASKSRGPPKTLKLKPKPEDDLRKKALSSGQANGASGQSASSAAATAGSSSAAAAAAASSSSAAAAVSALAGMSAYDSVELSFMEKLATANQSHKKELEDLAMFEMLEEAACDSSFCSSSSTVKKLIQGSSTSKMPLAKNQQQTTSTPKSNFRPKPIESRDLTKTNLNDELDEVAAAADGNDDDDDMKEERDENLMKDIQAFLTKKGATLVLDDPAAAAEPDQGGGALQAKKKTRVTSKSDDEEDDEDTLRDFASDDMSNHSGDERANHRRKYHRRLSDDYDHHQQQQAAKWSSDEEEEEEEEDWSDEVDEDCLNFPAASRRNSKAGQSGAKGRKAPKNVRFSSSNDATAGTKAKSPYDEPDYQEFSPPKMPKNSPSYLIWSIFTKEREERHKRMMKSNESDKNSGKGGRSDVATGDDVTNRFHSTLLNAKLCELEKAMEQFRKESESLKAGRRKLHADKKQLAQDIADFERTKEADKKHLEELRKRLRREKSMMEKAAQKDGKRSNHEKKAQEEIDDLQAKVSKLTDELERKECKWGNALNKLQDTLKFLERENQALHEENHKLKLKGIAPKVSTRLVDPAKKMVGNMSYDPQNKQPQDVATSSLLPATGIAGATDATLENGGQANNNSSATQSAACKNDINRKQVKAVADAEMGSNAAAAATGFKTDGTDKNNAAAAGLVTMPSLDFTPRLAAFSPVESLESDVTLVSASGMTTNNSEAVGGGQPKTGSDNKKTYTVRSVTRNETKGTTEKVYGDGRTEICYANGNRKEVSADGKTTRVLYYNGDVKECIAAAAAADANAGNQHQLVKYFYSQTKTWHLTYPDGKEVLQFNNGQEEVRYPNGSLEISFSDGSVKKISPDGSEHIKFPDSTQVFVKSNGDRTLMLANGQKEIHTAEYKRREYPDGTVKMLYEEDGRQETHYASGRVRIKDKTGKLLHDSSVTNNNNDSNSANNTPTTPSS